MRVTKADGDVEAFDEAKLRESLLRAGARQNSTDAIVTHVTRELSDGSTTDAIFDHAFSLLSKDERAAAARYSLKRAILQLGPTGFPFEAYIARLLEAMGFTARTNVVLAGSCVEHEIDVLAQNDKRFIVVEAKYHNRLGDKTDVKVALYVHSRFEDLERNNFGGDEIRARATEGWIVTNTKFTENAIRYAGCANLMLIGWSYPKTGNLQDLIEQTALHPLTCLTSLTQSEKRTLFDAGEVLCSGLLGSDEKLRMLGLPDDRIGVVLAEAANLCAPHGSVHGGTAQLYE